jgi:hypothetical protein
MTRRRRWKVLAFLPLAVLACSSTLEPRENVTLLVTNETCETGTCSPLRILGFPDNQPATPGGFWSIELGVLTGPSACLTLPASREFHVTEVPGGKTTTYRWTSANGLSLGAQPASESQLLARPSTAEFIPASMEAWSVTLPGDGDASPAVVCTP